MERIILSFTLLVFVSLNSFNAEAFPGADHYYKVPAESDAHMAKGSAYHLALDPTSIKAFVWNIKKSEETAWQQEFQNYTLGKDLLLLQETFLNDLFLQTISAMSGMRWDMGIGFFYRIYNDTATGTMIGSSTMPTFVEVQHSADREPFVGTPKAVTFARYPVIGSKELLVISVHGINLTSDATFERQMDRTAIEISHHDGPVLLAGDFNTRNHDRTKYLEDLVQRLKLDTVQFKYAEYRMVWKFTKYYLDHAFVRGLTVKNAEVLKDSKGSDHKPLTLELSIAD